MLIDILSGRIIGISALLYALGAFLAGRVSGLELKKKILTDLLLVLIVTELNILFKSGVYYLFGFSASSAKLGLEMLINPVFNAALMFILFPLLDLGRERKEELGFIFKKKA